MGLKETASKHLTGHENLRAVSADTPMDLPEVSAKESIAHSRSVVFHSRLNMLANINNGEIDVTASAFRDIEQKALEAAIHLVDDGIYTEDEMTDYLYEVAGLGD